ncbi:TPA: hypothetical protein ACPJ1I_004272 [Vibrio diabolicus]
MKSRELMQMFEIGARIMSFYKNKDVLYALNDILDMCERKEESSYFQHVNDEVISDSIGKKFKDTPVIEDIDAMSIDDLYYKLNDRKLFPNVDSIKKFAVSIGLRGQSRVNRENLIHSIIKFVERSRIDQDISSRISR